jgi:hypothetical protein
VQFNEEAEVKCPYRDAEYACNSVLQEREIKAVSETGIIFVICCSTTDPPCLQRYTSWFHLFSEALLCV